MAAHFLWLHWDNQDCSKFGSNNAIPLKITCFNFVVGNAARVLVWFCIIFFMTISDFIVEGEFCLVIRCALVSHARDYYDTNHFFSAHFHKNINNSISQCNNKFDVFTSELWPDKWKIYVQHWKIKAPLIEFSLFRMEKRSKKRIPNLWISNIKPIFMLAKKTNLYQ